MVSGIESESEVNTMSDIDMNLIFNLIAEGKITVDQVNYLLNSHARHEERVNEANGQEKREVSSPGTNHPSNLI